MSSPKRALVIGGASGIGLATVRSLRLQGYEAVVADVNAVVPRRWPPNSATA